MKSFNHRSFRFLLYTTCVLSFLFPSLIFGEDAILEATRSEFQKIPIWVMGFSSVQQQDNKIPGTDRRQSSICSQRRLDPLSSLCRRGFATQKRRIFGE